MADNWTDWYSGSMAPPVRLPGGGYLPAPSVQAPMSVEDIYRGIIPSVPSAGLSAVSRPAVPINPATGMPYATTVSAKAQYAGGVGAGGSGAVNYVAPRQFQANPLPGIRDLGVPQYGTPGMGGGVLTPSGLPNNATTEKRFDQRLMPQLPVVAGGYGKAGASGTGSGSFSLPRVPSAPDDGVIDLSTLDLSDRGAQGMADSQGAPVRAKSGKVYYPGGKASTAPRTTPAAAPAQRSGLLGALFGNSQGGGLFGGGSGRAPVAITVRGGNPAPATSASTYTTTPFQEDRFQTTTGAVMPKSMDNDRWRKGD